MKSRSFFPLSILVILPALVNCGNDSSSAGYTGSGSDTSRLPPVETKKANTSYKPAFAGQTRIGAVRTTTPYQTEKLNVKLDHPWAIVPLPDGRLLVTERKGYMQLHDANGQLLKKLTGFPAVDDRGQGGLLDVAPDPAFASNKTIYWSFSEKYPPGNLTAVAKGTINEAKGIVENVQVIFRAAPALQSNLHFGSRLLFDKKGFLYVSSGERSILEGRQQAQWLTSGLGKVFKITKDGKPAPGNPFAGRTDAMPEIYAYGFRNVQSLDIHPVTGDLWEAEFGPRGGDELNLIRAGKNYGWPVITYGIEYGGEKIGDAIQQKAGMEQPVYYWDPVLSPSGMSFYRGKAIPEWENNLFIGGLSSQYLCRLVIVNNKVAGEEKLLSELNERFRDVAYLDGKLYVVTDSGKMYRLSKK